MDSLSHVLNTVRLRSSVYCRSELGSPWGLHFAPRSCAVFHVLHRGNGYLCVEGDAGLLPLREGDVVLLPGGEEHSILETPDAPLFRNLELDQWGECALMRWSDAPTAVILCGTFDFEHIGTYALLKHLPRVVHIPRSDNSALNSILALMASEAEAGRPAKEVALRRLADILFIQIIQRWVEIEGIERCGWFGALHDPLIGRALELIHAQPQHPWTVAALARAVACSRSFFAARFTALVGEPPMEYLRRWRLQLATHLLMEHAHVSAGDIAARIGYHSEAAFSKAFKRSLGIAPGAYRKRHSAARSSTGARDANGIMNRNSANR
ncbi:MAG: AraC family transcriptional regulator [Roseiflexus castenholzii]|uniref:AraC family transcriptional regulator n=1 Tax=Roseiflexus castenholzii TaxID=120962 RepID=UPI000CB3CEA7|nr:MAG: AraC family transcriptional regulator [Roseiflexus castenholzii]